MDRRFFPIPYFVFRQGYTLIEVLVGLTIIALLFTGGFAGYREFARRQSLENAFQELRGNLSLTQQLALSGEKPSSCTDSLAGYQVDFSATSYTITAHCGSTQVTVRTIELPGGVELSSPSSVFFKVLGQGTNLSSNITVTLTHTSTGKIEQGTITTNGKLERL